MYLYCIESEFQSFRFNDQGVWGRGVMIELNDKINSALEIFKDKKILVVGDIILDKFVRGKVTRISPEAPVPVVDVHDEQYMPGGAGNVVSNILELGANVSIGGVIGDDFFGDQLTGIFKEMGADISGIIVDKKRPTSLKTRIIAEHQQVVRTDLESKAEIEADIADGIIKWIGSIIENIDGVVISDYGKGLITTNLIELIIKSARIKDIPVVVDPQVGHFFEYKGVTSITPNQKEAGEALKMVISDEESLAEVGKRLLKELGSESILITRGEKGMALFLKDGRIMNIPTLAREVYDVSGAGDTVVSIFTLGLTAGLDLYDSAVLSNYAAAVVVSKLGTATATIEEIKREILK